MFDISQRVERGQLKDVHVFRATETEVDVREGPPPSLTHPSTWLGHDGVHSNAQRPVSSKGKERERDCSSSRSGRGSQRLVMHGEGSDEEAEAGAEEKKVGDFKDHEMEYSKRDEARMKAHGWKADLKERVHGKEKGPDVDPAVTAALNRPSSRGSSATASPPPRRPADLSQPLSASPTSNGYPTFLNGAHSSEPISPRSPLPPALYAEPRRSESPEPMSPTPRSSTPQPLDSAPAHHDQTPVVNAPGHVVTNSRTPPSLYASNLTSSPPRLVPTASLTKPLHPNPSNSSLRPPSNSSPSVRRSNTTGSGLFPTTSRTSNSSRLSGSPLQPARALSYQQPSSAGGEGTSHLGEVFDEVESSIAAQAEVIRKQRQEKRAEKEKEAQDQVKGMGIGGGVSGNATGPGGAPMMKRRSTRAGSGDSGAPGAGVLVGNLIGQDHANYVLMYNMLTGIRIGVSSVTRLRRFRQLTSFARRSRGVKPN